MKPRVYKYLQFWYCDVLYIPCHNTVITYFGGTWERAIRIALAGTEIV